MAPGGVNRSKYRKPSFSLAGLLYLVACLSISLTVGITNGKALHDDSEASPSVDWRYGLSTLATAGSVTALLQQASTLPSHRRFRLAKALRYGWMAMLLVCFLSHLLLIHGVVSPPKREGFFLSFWEDPFPDAIWLFFLITAATILSRASKHRTNSPEAGRSALSASLLRSTSVVGCGCLLAVLIVWYMNINVFLNHLATEAIETWQPLQWRRADVFPDHPREGYSSAKTALAAVVALAATTAAVIVALSSNHRRLAIVARVLAASGIVTLGAYSWWFFAIDFPRVSPDLASAGCVGTAVDRAAAIWLFLCTTFWFAASLASNDKPRPVPIRLDSGLGWAPMATAAFGLIGGSGWSVFTYAVYSFEDLSLDDAWKEFEWFADAVVFFLCSPYLILTVAAVLAGLRLAKRTLSNSNLIVVPISTAPLLEAWLWLGILGAIGLLILQACGFCSWLAPWWR